MRIGRRRLRVVGGCGVADGGVYFMGELLVEEEEECDGKGMGAGVRFGVIVWRGFGNGGLEAAVDLETGFGGEGWDGRHFGGLGRKS